MSELDLKAYIDQSFTTQEEVFEFIAQVSVKEGFATSEEDVQQGLLEREKEGTTGMMDGFAIPHANKETIEKASLVIVRLSEAIDWDSMDGKPTDFILSLLIPKAEKGTTHLKMLSSVSKMLMRQEAKEALRNATSEEEIRKVINDNI